MMELPPCFYCAGRSYRPLFKNVQDRLGVVSGRWEFWRCQFCRSATLFPQPDPKELVSFYPPAYDSSLLSHWEYRFFFQPQHKAQARRILRGTSPWNHPDRSLLDVGCGTGLRLLAFRQLGFKVHGVDFRPETVETLQKQLGIPAVCTDVVELSQHFPPASFDVITAFHLLEHVPDVYGTLENCFQLLKPNRWIVCVVPLVDSLQAGLFKSRWTGASEAPRHLSLPSRQGVRKILYKVGFDKVVIHPNSLLDCLGVFVLSLLPSVGRRHFDQRSWFQMALQSAMATGIGLLAVPWCISENYLFRRPAVGMVFARKPE